MVPTEIVDHILSFLDHTTLETCLVVFPQIVDRHLYPAHRLPYGSPHQVGLLCCRSHQIPLAIHPTPANRALRSSCPDRHHLQITSSHLGTPRDDFTQSVHST